MGKKLTPKQGRFIEEYLVDLNATDAARRAGYSPKTAKEMGYENLTKPHIAAAIQKRMDALSKKTGVTAERVIEELAKLGFGNIKKIYTEDGDLTPIHKLPDEVAATITEVTEKVMKVAGEDRVVERKYKVADKRGSLELLGKHLKLFTERHELSNPDGSPLVPPTIEITFTKPDLCKSK